MSVEGRSVERILAETVDMLVEVAGEEILVLGDITMDTSFADDLALESIEFVALAERLHRRYGEQVDLMGLLADLDIDEIMAMSVGMLVRHIDACLAAPSAELDGAHA